MRKLFKFLQQERKGSVAVEAAIILPLIVFLIVGLLEVYQYFRVVAVVDRAAYTIANGLALQSRLQLGQDPSCTDPTDICTYAKLAPQLLSPQRFSTNPGLKVHLFVHDDDALSDWEPLWAVECPSAGACVERTADQALLQSLPPVEDEDAVFVIDLQQEYTPFLLSSQLWRSLGSGPAVLSKQAVLRPRSVRQPPGLEQL